MLITKDMPISDTVRKYPQTAPVFMEFGMGCLGCAAARSQGEAEVAQFTQDHDATRLQVACHGDVHPVEYRLDVGRGERTAFGDLVAKVAERYPPVVGGVGVVLHGHGVLILTHVLHLDQSVFLCHDYRCAGG